MHYFSGRMKKDSALTFRLPAALRAGLEVARGKQSAARFVLTLIARALVRAGVIDSATAADAMVRAPRSDRGIPKGTRRESEPARRRRGRPASQRVAGDRVPRNA